jgi:hypothetical protein
LRSTSDAFVSKHERKSKVSRMAAAGLPQLELIIMGGIQVAAA